MPAARRESHLEIASWALPDRFRPYFVEVGLGGCRRVGLKRVLGRSGARNVEGINDKFYGKTTRVAYGDYGDRHLTTHVDADGLETVEAWECEEGCCAAILNVQSGDRPSTLTGRADPRFAYENPGDNNGRSLFGAGNSVVYADSGGASRFYPQFANDYELWDWIAKMITPV